MLATLQEMAGQVAARLQALGLAGRTVSIKARFPDFETVTRAHTDAQAIWRPEAIAAHLPGLLDHAFLGQMGRPTVVRLLGVTVSSLTDADSRLELCHSRQMSLLEAMTALP